MRYASRDLGEKKSYFFYTLISSLEMTPLTEAAAIVSYFCTTCSAFLTYHLIFVKLPLSDIILSLHYVVVAIFFLTKLV